MPVGTGAETLKNVPDAPFIEDPSAFFQMTKRHVGTPKSIPLPAAGSFDSAQIPQANILTKILVTFVGTLTSTPGTGTVTPTNEWPHNLIRDLALNLNGATDIFHCDGRDLHALRFVRYPAYDERVDVFPGAPPSGYLGDVGAPAVAAGNHDLNLTWEIPVSMDDVSNIGALYMQSPAQNAVLRIQRALDTDLFTLAGGATVALAGRFYIQTTTFAIPFNAEGKLITPDLSLLHSMQATEQAFVQVGENRVPLIRTDGNLARLFISGESADNASLSARPARPAASRIDRLGIEYGAQERPFTWDPAASLLAINNQHYGAVVPYERIVVDTVKENPARDAILMRGLTELAALITVNAAVNVTAGRLRIVQETLA